MVSLNTSNTITPEWFRSIGSPAILTETYRDKLDAMLAAQKQKDEDAFEELMLRIQEGGTDVNLSAADLAYLIDHYDPKNMTSEEYRSFVDDLCRLGVFDEADKEYVSSSVGAGGMELTRIDLSAQGGTITPVYSRYNNSFASSNGNVLDWAKYLSTVEYFDSKTQSFAKTRSAVLFEMMKNVLDQMAA